jgi:hypothetical protein
MPAAIHSLLSSTGIFKGECEEFGHMVSNSEGNGYLALYQIVRLVHPVLGKISAQPPKPQQKKAQPFAEHIANYLDYFQSELCSGGTYLTNERVIIVLSRLHPTWRDAMKRKYTTLVPQNGVIPPIPMEFQLAMLSVTPTQWCVEELLELPSANNIGPSSSVFAIQDSNPKIKDTYLDIAHLTLNVSHPSILFGHTSIDTGTVDRAIQHIMCYADRGSKKSSYPKCTACGLPGHTLEQCNPLVNFCLAQALAAQHPDIVKHIKAAYAQFPRLNRSRPPRVSSVKQLVSLLDLPPEESISGPEYQAIMHSSHHIDLIETLDLLAENVSHGHSGSAIVSFQDRSWFPSSQESPAQVFKLVESHAPQCVLFQEYTPHKHQVHSMHPHHALLVDSGSTIMTVGRSDMLSSYVSPSPSGISMRSATGQIVRPEGEGRITFDINTGTGSLSVVCQHTPAIKSNIFSPAATYISLDYDVYQLTCDRRAHTSQISFRKSGTPAITIHGTYVQRMPLISLPPAGINSLVPTVPRLLDIAPSARQPEPLNTDSSLAIHQVLRLISLAHHHPVPIQNIVGLE